MSLGRSALVTIAVLATSQANGQPRPTPALSASVIVMAGAMLGVGVARAPAQARLAIARIDDPTTRAIIVVELAGRSAASLQTPGEPGTYELRLTQDRDGAPVVLLRQPLTTTPAVATVAGPARIARGKPFRLRGIGPNGEQDRVVIVPAGASLETVGPFFFPHENVEATLDAPEQPGAYELRYVMDAPVSGRRVLARQVVTVE